MTALEKNVALLAAQLRSAEKKIADLDRDNINLRNQIESINDVIYAITKLLTTATIKVTE